MAIETYGDLRKALSSERLDWTVDRRHADTAPIRRYPLGGELTLLPKAATLPRVDVAALLRATPPLNTLLHARLVERAILPHLARPGLPRPGTGTVEAGGGGPAATVDWRNRFGWPWITTIRDQDPCEHCWIYAATALVESMVRIEHCVWSPRSVGDYIEANRVPCGQCGDPVSVLNWFASHGVADLDCVPWVDRDPGDRSSTYWNPPPTGCGSGSMQAPPAWNPLPGRDGRSTRVPSYTSLGHVQDQKDWIDTVGPLVVTFDVYNDFFGWSGTKAYKRLSTATFAGSHVVLAVGYDDAAGGWIIKNSWGTGWGNAGWGLIAYGQCNIDSNAKLGLRLVNPDPWTKRRHHGGGMLESGDGALHRNFELIAPAAGHALAHWWRDNSATSLPWHKAATMANDVAEPPTFTETSFNRNFEMVYRTTAGRLHHRYFDQAAQAWRDGPVFGPTNASGGVGFIESSWGPRNFEVVVGVGGNALQHWWRDSAFHWHETVTFGSNVATMGPTLLQSTWGALELVAVLKSGQMQHWWRREAGGEQWISDQVFGADIASPPCMIQGSYGMADEMGHGNFELCVATRAGTIEHWWRNNQNSGFIWSKSATFGSGVARVIALVQGSFGFNLEVVALRTDGMLQHYWRDGGGWHAGVVIGSTH